MIKRAKKMEKNKFSGKNLWQTLKQKVLYIKLVYMLDLDCKIGDQNLLKKTGRIRKAL